jgi:hypothetical protein
MESSFTVKVSELDGDFVKILKRLFKNDREITITVSSATDFGLNEVETKEQYIARIERALKNVESGKGLNYSEKEIEDMLSHMSNK